MRRALSPSTETMKAQLSLRCPSLWFCSELSWGKKRTTKGKADKLDETREMEKKIELSQKETDRSAMAEPPQCRCRCFYHGPGIDSGLCGQLNMKLMSCFIRLISSNNSSQ